MERYLGPHLESVYALFRAACGILFFCHGLQKVFGMFGGAPAEMTTRLWIAGGIELVAGAMICVGLEAGSAAFLASGTMAFAYFLVHAPRALLPIVNKGELAALYCFALLLIAAKGSGIASIDALRRRR